MKVKIEIRHDDASDLKKIVITEIDSHRKWEFYNPGSQNVVTGNSWIETMSINTLHCLEHMINTILQDD